MQTIKLMDINDIAIEVVCEDEHVTQLAGMRIRLAKDGHLLLGECNSDRKVIDELLDEIHGKKKVGEMTIALCSKRCLCPLHWMRGTRPQLNKAENLKKEREGCESIGIKTKWTRPCNILSLQQERFKAVVQYTDDAENKKKERGKKWRDTMKKALADRRTIEKRLGIYVKLPPPHNEDGARALSGFDHRFQHIGKRFTGTISSSRRNGRYYFINIMRGRNVATHRIELADKTDLDIGWLSKLAKKQVTIDDLKLDRDFGLKGTEVTFDTQKDSEGFVFARNLQRANAQSDAPVERYVPMAEHQRVLQELATVSEFAEDLVAQLDDPTVDILEPEEWQHTGGGASVASVGSQD